VLMRVWGFLCCITLVYNHPMGFEALKKLHQLGARKLPLEGARLAVREFFIEAQTLFDVLQTDKVVRREHLALHDREVDFPLIEPTGMDGGMHHKEMSIGLGQPVDSRLAPVRRAIIYHPE